MEQLAEISTLIARHTGTDGQAMPIPGIRLLSSSVPTEPINGFYEPAFALVAQGAKRTMVGNRIFEYGAGQYLVVSLGLPIAGHVTTASHEEPYLAFRLSLNPPVIASLLLEASTANQSTSDPLGLAVSHASPEIIDAVIRLLRLIDRPEDLAILWPMLEREILWRLLTGEQGNSVRQIGLADSRLSQINRAIRWIRAHYAEIFRIDDLADIAGMSAASFHRHFRAITAMSPLQYQKQIRLQQARAWLIAESRDVASVGFAVGYESPSQFSREYRRLFGVPPGKDIVRLRSSPQPGLA
ncbi:AraC family transcriptional regulator [Phyllobacterium myrsinacearum]|uniref:AraC-like DNA-binding protein n=1 Tax=Phyllobacterium myrsinacearum TaxID=28101 RepID=A0A839EU06_9HYPH|nr:AraC family transcriptional regulator [Phyllobacterium myrsinacearum]MBA8880836.1 AraC-like DNA-binding protein [Phyllobacterium myrsinacearum]